MATTNVRQPILPLVAAEVLEETESPGVWTQAFRRLRKNRAALLSLAIVVLLYVVAIFAPLIAPYDPDGVHFDAIQTPPAWAQGGNPLYLLGTDGLGRDALSRLIFGARVSMSIGMIPAVLYLLIGGSIGLVAGYSGGFVDALLMRIVDVFYALPDLLILITLVTLLRETAVGNLLSGMVIILAALALFNWVGTARLVRGQVLSYKEMAFVEAAQALGASPRRVVLRHIVPHVLAPVIVQLAFVIPGAIIAESILSFIGIGIRPPSASWGNMILDGYGALQTQPVWALAPAACIALVTLSFTFLGDGLRDALDPKMRI
jgi:oligopeptide transport system permease protein